MNFKGNVGNNLKPQRISTRTDHVEREGYLNAKTFVKDTAVADSRRAAPQTGLADPRLSGTPIKECINCVSMVILTIKLKICNQNVEESKIPRMSKDISNDKSLRRS